MKPFRFFILLSMVLSAEPGLAATGNCSQPPAECSGSGLSYGCFDWKMACGEAPAVIDAITLQQDFLKPRDFFYLGSAYYQLFLETQPKSQRCLYYKRSRNALATYIGSRASAMSQGEPLGLADVQGLRHANKIYQDLAIKAICPDALPSAAEIKIKVKGMVDEDIRQTLIKSRDPKIEIAVNDVKGRINNLINLASSIESRTRILEAEETAAENMLASLNQDSPLGGLAEFAAKAQAIRTKLTGYESFLSSRLGQYTVDDYGTLRKTSITSAQSYGLRFNQLKANFERAWGANNLQNRIADFKTAGSQLPSPNEQIKQMKDLAILSPSHYCQAKSNENDTLCREGQQP